MQVPWAKMIGPAPWVMITILGRLTFCLGNFVMSNATLCKSSFSSKSCSFAKTAASCNIHTGYTIKFNPRSGSSKLFLHTKLAPYQEIKKTLTEWNRNNQYNSQRSCNSYIIFTLAKLVGVGRELWFWMVKMWTFLRIMKSLNAVQLLNVRLENNHW